MRQDLEIRRRVLAVAYRRYIEADLSWTRARQAARLWFPEPNRPYRWTIGDPRSPLRQLYERRQKALIRLVAARRKLAEARSPMDRKSVGLFLLVNASA